MPVVRKVYNSGACKLLRLPKGWIEYIRRVCGCDVREVYIDICNVKLVIKPAQLKLENRGGDGG